MDINITTYLFNNGKKIGFSGSVSGNCCKCGNRLISTGEHSLKDSLECNVCGQIHKIIVK